MIFVTRITYGNYGGRYYFEASGHAISEDFQFYGEEKESGVCAAVSMLVLSAAELLSDMRSSGEIFNASIEVESGYACFDLSVNGDADEKIDGIFAVLMSGFLQLEENYPELVSCE